MKRILVIVALLACVSVLQAQLDKPITRNYLTAAGPTVPFDSINVSALTSPAAGNPLIARLCMYSVVNWSTADTLTVVQSSSDTTASTVYYKLGPGVSFSTPRAVPLICIKLRGSTANVKYSLVIQ